MGLEQPVVAKGMLSSKSRAPGYLGEGFRDVAWLDLSINRGNSGGPLVLLGDRPAADRVVGIITFNLNPHANDAAELARLARETKESASVRMIGIDFAEFAELTGRALAANSLGVGGCVSINYVKDQLAALK